MKLHFSCFLSLFFKFNQKKNKKSRATILIFFLLYLSLTFSPPTFPPAPSNANQKTGMHHDRGNIVLLKLVNKIVNLLYCQIVQIKIRSFCRLFRFSTFITDHCLFENQQAVFRCCLHGVWFPAKKGWNCPKLHKVWAKQTEVSQKGKLTPPLLISLPPSRHEKASWCQKMTKCAMSRGSKYYCWEK